MFLAFSEGGTRYSLQRVRADAPACVRANAPPALLAELDELGSGVSRQRSIWRTNVGGSAVLGLAVGLLA